MAPPNSLRWEIEQALTQEGCCICRVSLKGIQRYLDGLLYENVNDPGVRQHTTAALGFCNRHAWQMRAMNGGSLGLALLHRDALKQWQKQIDRVHKPNEGSDLQRYREEVARANESKEPCPACQKQAEIEKRYIATLLESLGDAAFIESFRQSSGLCRPHLGKAIAAVNQTEALDALIDAQTRVNRRLAEELDEFIRKNDYRFTGEGFGTEGDSWIRAIARLSGAEGARG